MLSWDEFDKEDGEVVAKGAMLATLLKPTWTASTAQVVLQHLKPVP